jgi:hypothetical protein
VGRGCWPVVHDGAAHTDAVGSYHQRCGSLRRPTRSGSSINEPLNESEVPEPEPEPDLTLHIEVSILSGRRTPLAVQPTDTVERVKHMLCSEVGVPPLEQRLLFNANELADTSTMEQNGVIDGCTFHLVLRLVVAGSAAKGELGQGLDSSVGAGPDIQ